MALVRTFIAVEFSESLKEQISEIQKSLKVELGKLKWVPKDNFHLTLKFIGDVESRQVPKMAEGLKRTVQGRKPFTVNLAGLGGFPQIHFPKVIWIGVNQGREGLIQLQTAVEDALVVQGFDRETRSYSPHLTLARSRDHTDLKAVGDVLKRFRQPVTQEELVQSIRIMKSNLRRGGPIYTCLEEIIF